MLQLPTRNFLVTWKVQRVGCTVTVKTRLNPAAQLTFIDALPWIYAIDLECSFIWHGRSYIQASVPPPRARSPSFARFSFSSTVPPKRFFLPLALSVRPKDSVADERSRDWETSWSRARVLPWGSGAEGAGSPDEKLGNVEGDRQHSESGEDPKHGGQRGECEFAEPLA